MGIFLVLALAAPAPAPAWAQGSGPTAPIEVRVWQDVGDELDIYVSARPAAGSWRTLGTIPLPLDDGVSSTGRFRYGDIALEVPLAGRASPATVEVRVWQDVGDSARVYISARPAGGDWGVLGTIRLHLGDGVGSTGRFRFGDISLDVPLLGKGVTTLAGQPEARGYRDGPGDQALFGHYAGLRLDVAPDGSVVVADSSNDAIRRVSRDGTVTTIVGGNGAGFLDGPGVEARFKDPLDVAVAADGSIYVAESHRIREISPDGVVTTVAGTGHGGSPRDGPAHEAVFNWIRGIALDDFGDLYIIEQYRVRRLTPTGWVDTVAGSELGYRDGPGGQALFDQLQDVAVDAAGTVYLLDYTNYATHLYGFSSLVRAIDARGHVRTLHRSLNPRHGGVLDYPLGMAVSGDGTVYLSNTDRHQVLALSESGELVPVAGTGVEGHLDGARSEARFRSPAALALSDDGVLFVAERWGVLRAIVPGSEGFAGEAPPLVVTPKTPRLTGVRTSLVAGKPGVSNSGAERYADGSASTALFDSPWGVAIDELGRLVVADTKNNAIRRIASDGTVTTIAGGGGPGYRDGPAEQALFNSPSDVAVDEGGFIYVADTHNQRIRKIAPGGAVSTVAGGGAVGGDAREPSDPVDGPAAEARFRDPVRLAFDPDGDLLIAEAGRRIRRLSTSGNVSTELDRGLSQHAGVAVDDQGAVYFTGRVKGTAVQKVTSDGAITTLFEDRPPGHGGVFAGLVPGIAVAPDGTVYVAAWSIGRVVRISPRGGVAIVVERGSTTGLSAFYPTSIVVDDDGDLIVADSVMNVIWRITLPDYLAFEPPSTW